jgi:hypothetical protein
LIEIPIQISKENWETFFNVINTSTGGKDVQIPSEKGPDDYFYQIYAEHQSSIAKQQGGVVYTLHG